jgi:type I restriction enzyme S subunit
LGDQRLESPSPKTALPEGYSETELGSLPEDWSVASLDEVAVFTRKPRSLKIADSASVAFIPMEGVPANGTLDCEFVLRPGNTISSGTYCEPGDVLLAKITPSLENGKQGISPTDVPEGYAVATTEVYPLKAQENLLDRYFLFAYLLYQPVRQDLAGKMEGSTGRQRLPKHVLANLLLPLPPLSEQQAIAQVLGVVREAIEATEQVIEATRELKRSLMAHLFTYGPVPVDEAEQTPLRETPYGLVPFQWEAMVLDSCAYVQSGVTKGRKLDGERTVEVPYLRVANVQDGYLDLSAIKTIRIRESELERYRLRAGDVLLTEGGDFDKLGRGFVWDEQVPNCIHQNHVFAVRADRAVLLPEYLAYLAQSRYGKAYFLEVAHRTTNLASINSTKLKAFPVLVPTLDLQWEIIEALQAVDEKIAVEETRKQTLEVLFKSLLHNLMTGKVRVNDLDIPGVERVV